MRSSMKCVRSFRPKAVPTLYRVKRFFSVKIPKPVRPLAYDLHKPVKFAKQPPIIFLHGLFGSKKNNRGISKVLARDVGAEVYALDLRNHGESPHDPRHDYYAMAEDVSAFIQDQKLGDVTLIGHSMGAKTAMTLALLYPELVSKIIAVDNAPVDAALNGDFCKYIRAMKNIQDANITRQAEADRILQNFEESLPIRLFLLGNLYKPAGESTQRFRIPLDTLEKSLQSLGDFPFKRPQDCRFEKPSLFVRGTKSHYVADNVIPAIGEFFPCFRLVDINAGHWVISENPEAFRQAIVNFLQEEP
ncbi:hypothetical protein E4U55_001182 [Claviceps digitariae]|nr:hypothetical protein E4U55_001182 [Claviceps digitariae]